MPGHGSQVLPPELVPVPGHGAQVLPPELVPMAWHGARVLSYCPYLGMVPDYYHLSLCRCRNLCSGTNKKLPVYSDWCLCPGTRHGYQVRTGPKNLCFGQNESQGFASLNCQKLLRLFDLDFGQIFAGNKKYRICGFFPLHKFIFSLLQHRRLKRSKCFHCSISFLENVLGQNCIQEGNKSVQVSNGLRRWYLGAKNLFAPSWSGKT